MQYKSIALRDADFDRVAAAKKYFEVDFARKVTWAEFLLILSTGYVMARQIMENEDKFILDLQAPQSD